MGNKHTSQTGIDDKALARAIKRFDIEDPVLPPEIEAAALSSGGFAYGEKMKRKDFEERLGCLQSELLKLQLHLAKKALRVAVLFEGRDGAGKGTCINHFLQHINTRHARSVALTKPTEIERGQWYFQRYVAHLPTAGDMVLFDRSWYNRAGVERVMGFCSREEWRSFLREAPVLEGHCVRQGLRLFKFYLDIGRPMQLVRFHERRHDPLKRWKLSDIDLAAMSKWDDFTTAQVDMFKQTHCEEAPWTVIRANDQRRARLEAIRAVLTAFDYEGREEKNVGECDPNIVGSGPEFFGFA
ncbi:MAG: polyphosphate kinase 2 [Hyphomicrobiaceae bacterium]|nr:MAG: polyphosphate kinase 2 [Hyphomicrobiaceae bacterium]